MKTLSSILLVLLLIPLIPGCVSEGCYEEIDSDLVISLYKTDSEDPDKIDSLTVYGFGMEDLKLYEMAAPGSLMLPLNPGPPSSTFVIINGTISDTLTIVYSSRYNFVSKGCGYNYLYTIKSISYTKNHIDTILVINESINPSDEENLRAFF
ncbi:MAG: DUF6452 family protein [Marinilabiliaceae bacterium]|nr:DUF6452 family protein [Marinilabiliaceae bacterium]